MFESVLRTNHPGLLPPRYLATRSRCYEWVVEGNIKACFDEFDEIDHSSLTSVNNPSPCNRATSSCTCFLFSSSAGEENTHELAAVLKLTESTVGHHLSQLRKAGLVESDRRGMNVYHHPHRDGMAALCAVLDPSCCS